jgi:hypothetical protein
MFLLRTEILQKRSLAKIVEGNIAFEGIAETQQSMKLLLDKHQTMLQALEVVAPSLIELDEFMVRIDATSA